MHPASQPPQVEGPLVSCGVMPRGFVDSVALNLYHDGSEGIQVCCRRLGLAWQ